MLDSPERILGLTAVVLGIVATGTALWLGLRRQARTIGALADAILGQEEVRDRSGAPVRDAQPGLAAQVKEMRDELSLLTQHGRRIAELEQAKDDHATRIGVLEDSRVEGALARVESTEAYRAIAAAQRNLGDQPDL